MKILLINKFLYPKGGDAISTLATGKLLRDKGEEVSFWGMDYPENSGFPYRRYFVSPINFNKRGGIKSQFKAASRILYSREAKKKLEVFINLVGRPDIVHLNNIAHQISPSILHIFRKYRTPMVMTLRDYKLVCPAYLLLAKGQPCEKCKNGRYYWCFINRCTKDSYLKSLVNTLEMYLHHCLLNIYDLIDVFISPSQFLKQKFREMGFKREIFYLPNFLFLDEFIPDYHFKERAIVYVGRLSGEKGLFTLLEAFNGLECKLKIIGEGPQKENLKLKVEKEKIDNIDFLGYKSRDELKDIVRQAMALVLPSECYENNPRSILEAFALGKPVIASRMGGIPELVRDNETGLTFKAGDKLDLKNKILYLIKNIDRFEEMGRKARKFTEENFNPEKHYQKLLNIYQMAIDRNKERN